MNYDDDVDLERPARVGMSYDQWKATEPDDSDVVYTKNWEEAEARAKRMVETAKQIRLVDLEFQLEKSIELVRERKERIAMIDKTNYTSIGIDPEKRMTWIFTFGYDHVHPVTGERLGNSYVQIEGTLNSAREVMIQHFGTKWSTQYPGISEAGVHKYSLREIPLPVMEVA